MEILRYALFFIFVVEVLGTRMASRGARRNSRFYHSRNRQRTPDVYFAPISGQRVRLGGNASTYMSGNIEVFLRNQWGMVCDDEWSTKEANVVCKQLGFTGGALSFQERSHYGSGRWNDTDILMDDVACSGNEKSITNCHYNDLSNCVSQEGAGVKCRPNTGCPVGWVAGPESCYFLSNITTTKKDFAVNKCDKLGGYLVNIDTEEESHFISNAFAKITGEPIITGALKKRQHWMWEKILRYGVDPPSTPAPTPETANNTIVINIADDLLSELENFLRTELGGLRKKRSARTRRMRRYRRNPRRQNNRPSGRNSETFVSSVSKTQTSIKYFKWFPGWLPGNEKQEPTNKKNTKCIYLKSVFPHPDKSVGKKDIGYLYWDDEICKRTKKKLKNGFRFMCERPRYVQDALIANQNGGNDSGPDVDCYSGRGVNYRGTHSSTEKGTPCIPWSVATGSLQAHKRINMNHNYCRNPDNDTKPWCYVNEELSYGFCPIPKCSEVNDVITTQAPTTTPSMTECPDTEFYCRNTNKCIAKSWHCDMEPDCNRGEDEIGCDYKILQFVEIPNSKLRPTNIKETFTRISNETCAKYCLSRESYVCRSFSFKSEGRICSLSEGNTQISGSPLQADDSNVYELRSQTLNCDGMFTCDNGRCIDQSLVCNHEDECGDSSDEASCLEDEPVEVRLVEGGETSGRVEVKYLGQWGTVCDDDWDTNDATVVCRMLGYTRGSAKATGNAKYGQGSGAFFLDDVACDGTETSIADCEHAGWKQHNCRGHEAAGVECETRKSCTKDQYTCDNVLCLEPASVCDGICDCRPNCTDEKGNGEFDCQTISLEVPGIVNPDDGSVAGRVEIVRNGLKGTVCDEGWDNNDAKVICRLLGYPYGKALSGDVVEDGTGPIWLEEVDCDGTEDSLWECNLGSWGTSGCDHSQDAGVRCSKQPLPEDPVVNVDPEPGKIQLVDGTSSLEGRIEVIKDGTRGTVCDDDFDQQDAAVVCRMLGYSGGSVKSFGAGSQSLPIVMDDVDCTGTERSLLDCKYPGWGVNDCGHGEDVGVVCDEPGESVDWLNPSVPCGLRPLETNSRVKREEPDFDLDDLRELAEAPKLERIIGGYTASRGFYPWQVGVRRHLGYGQYTHWCGGTIIHDNWIVSAAHCFVDTHKSHIRLRTGDHDNKVQDTYEQEFEADLIINHENYDADSMDNDIALIKVKPAIKFNNHVQPACLPDPAELYVTGQKCHVSGWGRTESGYQNMLKAAKVPLISDRTCNLLYYYKITANMVCAGYLEGGIDTCAGDSGGPLVCKMDDKYTLMGATSFGADCAKSNAPGVYARVTQYISWIKQKIKRHS